MGEPIRLGQLLGAVPGLEARLREARLLEAWPAIAGPAAHRSRALRVEDGYLHVAVDGSGWLHRLTLEEANLLERCRAIAPIRGLRLQLARQGTDRGGGSPTERGAAAPGSGEAPGGTGEEGRGPRQGGGDPAREGSG